MRTVRNTTACNGFRRYHHARGGVCMDCGAEVQIHTLADHRDADMVAGREHTRAQKGISVVSQVAGHINTVLASGSYLYATF